VLFPGDNTNFVEWDCNGFKAINLHGIFAFSEGLLIPVDTTKTKVTSEFEVYINDINNIVTDVSFPSFYVKGAKDFTFTVENAALDMSDYLNPPTITFPTNYNQDRSTLWRGFYIRDFRIGFPKELTSPGNNPKEIYARDMLIDESGVSGNFGVDNLLYLNEGDMNGWDFSVENINLEFTSNKVTGGGMEGAIVVPPLDRKEFGYAALISPSATSDKADFSFTVQTNDSATISAFKADLDIYPSSKFTIQRSAGSFQPTIELNGKLSVNDKLKLPSLKFEYLTLTSEAPYITNGIFSLVSNQTNKLSNFPISIEEVKLGINAGNIVLGAKLGLNLSPSNEANAFSVKTGVTLFSKIVTTPATDYSKKKIDLVYDKFTVNDIYLEVRTTPFEIEGGIVFRNDHPIYGDGFRGDVSITISSVIPNPISLSAEFGSKDDYRYWSVAAAVPTKILCGPYAEITSISGGLSNHMTGSKSDQKMIEEIQNGLYGGKQIYVPSETTGIAFSAGVRMRFPEKESTYNADLLFSIVFNSNGGFQRILFIGDIYGLVTREERNRSKNQVHGTASFLYDHEEEILDIQTTVSATYAGVLSANIRSQLYFSPDLWFFHFGTPSQKNHVTIFNLATVQAYFMAGQQLPPAVLPVRLRDKPENINRSPAIALGDGFAFGVFFGVGFDASVGLLGYELYAKGGVGAGFDISLLNYDPKYYCSQLGRSNRIGLNGWRINGQLYAYAYLAFGLKGRNPWGFGNFDIQFLDLDISILFEAKLPRPTFLSAEVDIRVKVIKIINIKTGFDVAIGTDCTIIKG